MKKYFIFIAFLSVFSIITFSTNTHVCNEIFLNKSINKVSSRSFDYDYPKDIQSKVVINPRGMHRKSTPTEPGDKTLEWTSKYGSVSLNVFQENACSDGINEHGLTAALLYLNETKYPDNDPRPALSNNYWAQYYLDNFKTVEEAIKDADKIRVVPVVIDDLLMPLHIVLHDASGDSAIMEYIDGKLVIYYPMPVNVLTNSPPYKQMLTELKKYKGFGGSKVPSAGHDSISRFVVSASNIDKIPLSLSPNENVAFLFDAIQNVTSAPGNEITSHWIVARDSVNKKFYYKTASDINVMMIDLKKNNFNKLKSEKVLTIGKEKINNVNKHFK